MPTSLPTTTSTLARRTDSPALDSPRRTIARILSKE
jgi:hypothetical protein